MHVIQPSKAAGDVDGVWFNLGKGEILRAHNRFGESIYRLDAKLNGARAIFLKITNANNPFWKCILRAFLKANPFM